jgi:hypothetical protein
MRNKRFFWGLTIILLLVCLYQLSFTWYASSEEKLAAKEAEARNGMWPLNSVIAL